MANKNKKKVVGKPAVSQEEVQEQIQETVEENTLEVATETQEQTQPAQPDLSQVMEMLTQLTQSVASLKEENSQLREELANTQNVTYQLEEQVLNSFRNEAVLVEAYRKEPKHQDLSNVNSKYAGIKRTDN